MMKRVSIFPFLLFALAVSLAFAIYGFLISLGGQSLFRTSLLED